MNGDKRGRSVTVAIPGQNGKTDADTSPLVRAERGATQRRKTVVESTEKTFNPSEVYHEILQIRRQRRQEDKSLFLFPYHSIFRTLLRKLVSYPAFDWFIFIVIFMNSVTMAMEEWLDARLVKASDIFCDSIFILEMSMRIIAYGFILGEKTYLRDGFNIIDFFCVITGVAYLIYRDTETAGGLIIKALRALRPLRCISRVQRLKLIIGAFIKSLPQLADALWLYVFLIFVFGIAGTNVWQGHLRFRCVQDNVVLQKLADRVCNPSRGDSGFFCPSGSECLDYTIIPMMNASYALPMKVMNPNPVYGLVNFDNIFFAALTLLVSVTLEGWTDNMHKIFDASGVGWAIYWVLFIVVGGFFLINLIIIIINQAFRHSRMQERMIASRRKLNRADFAAEFNPSIYEDRDVDIVEATVSITEIGSKVQRAIDNKYSKRFTLLCVIVNVGFMCSEHAFQSDSYTTLVNRINTAFTALFFLEVSASMFVKGLRSYLTNNWDRFDLLILVFSIIGDVLLSFITYQEDTLLRSMRMLRICRVLRTLKVIESLKDIVISLLASAQETVLLTLLLFIVILIYALLGNYLFKGVVTSTKLGKKLTSGFGDMLESALTVFIVLTGDNWNSILYESMKCTGYWACLFFITLFFIARYVVVNLFIAVLLSSIESGYAANEEDWDKIELTLRTKKNGFTALLPTKSTAIVQLECEEIEMAVVEDYEKMKSPQGTELKGEVEELLSAEQIKKVSKVQRTRLGLRVLLKSVGVQWALLFCIAGSCAVVGLDNQLDSSKILYRRRLDVVETTLNVIFTVDVILNIFAFGFFNNKEYTEIMRLDAKKAKEPDVGAEKREEGQPEGEEEEQKDVEKAQMNIMFGAEVLGQQAKMLENLGRDLIRLDTIPKPYFREPWNYFDCVIIAFTWASYIPGFTPADFIPVLRSLRPLRFFQRAKAMQAVLTALLKSLRELVSVVGFAFVFYLLFSLVGIQLFRGRFARCITDPGGPFVDTAAEPYKTMGWRMAANHCSIYREGDMANYYIDEKGVLFGGLGPRRANTTSVSLDLVAKTMTMDFYGVSNVATNVTVLADPRWTLPRVNFDHIGYSLLTMYTVSTMEGWADIMNLAMDAKAIEEGNQPDVSRDRPNRIAVFFIAFILLVSFLILNLFVSVLLAQYHKVMKEGGTILRGKDQQEWISIWRSIVKSRPVRKTMIEPSGKYQKKVFTVLRHPYFDKAVAVAIATNAVWMSLEYYGTGSQLRLVLIAANCGYSLFYATEAAMKIFCFGPKAYFSDKWCKFDFGVTVATVAGMIYDLQDRNVSATSSVISITRLLRMVRVIKLIPAFKGVRTLMQTFVLSLPDFANVVAFLSVFFFIYAVFGCRVLGKSSDGQYINDYSNFRTVGFSLLTLFRLMTGENWANLLIDIVAEPCADQRFERTFMNNNNKNLRFEPADCPASVCNQYIGQCIPPYIAIIYFVSFELLASLIFVNLFIAVIVENFENASSSNDHKVDKHHIAVFTIEWIKLDTECTGYIRSSDLLTLLFRIGPPLGIRLEDTSLDNPGDDEDESEDDGEAIFRRKVKCIKDISSSSSYYVQYTDTLVGLIEDVLSGPVPSIIKSKIEDRYRDIMRRFAHEESYNPLNAALLDDDD